MMTASRDSKMFFVDRARQYSGTASYLLHLQVFGVLSDGELVNWSLAISA